MSQNKQPLTLKNVRDNIEGKFKKIVTFLFAIHPTMSSYQ